MFRLAILGDFSGRAARGVIETGDALAARRAIKLDIDTLDEVIEGFRTELSIPVGEGGPTVTLELTSLDELHPDELYENLAVFAELSDLRRAVSRGAAPAGTLQTLRKHGGEAPPLRAVPGPARGSAIPADRGMGDFAALIGAPVTAAPPSPVEDLVARVVGPYIVDAPDPGAKELTAAIDQALSATMSLILHHPDVQAIEAQWRALDFLARRIETGADVALTLYDVSAEEVAVDLATTADPAEGGLYRMLSGTAAGDEGFAVVAGLYTFEATPPHAELLARIGGIASRLGAPFLAALEPHAADGALQEAHPSVAEAFGALAALPEADAVGLVAPPVLLRRPYGAKSDPVDAFAYEEFDRAEGLTGLLWGNPVLVAATLLAANRGPGRALELDDMPYHITTDRHGDQVALPATQRIMTEARVAAAQGWGVMPVLATRGGDRVRLGGFHAVTGRPLAGHWGAAAGRRPPSDAPGRGVGLSLSHQLTAAELADLRGRASAGQATGPADIDPDLAALLEDPE